MVSGTSQARPGCPEFLSFLVVCFGARAAARGGFQSLELVRPLSISVGISVGILNDSSNYDINRKEERSKDEVEVEVEEEEEEEEKKGEKRDKARRRESNWQVVTIFVYSFSLKGREVTNSVTNLINWNY